MGDVASAFAGGGFEAHAVGTVLFGVQIDEVDVVGITAVELFGLETGVGGAVDGTVVGLARSALRGLVLEVRELRVGQTLGEEQAVINDRAGHLVSLRRGATSGRCRGAEERLGVVGHDRLAGGGIRLEARLVDKVTPDAMTKRGHRRLGIVGLIPTRILQQRQSQRGYDIRRGGNNARKCLGIEQPLLPMIPGAGFGTRRLILQLRPLTRPDNRTDSVPRPAPSR